MITIKWDQETIDNLCFSCPYLEVLEEDKEKKGWQKIQDMYYMIKVFPDAVKSCIDVTNGILKKAAYKRFIYEKAAESLNEIALAAQLVRGTVEYSLARRHWDSISAIYNALYGNNAELKSFGRGFIHSKEFQAAALIKTLPYNRTYGPGKMEGPLSAEKQKKAIDLLERFIAGEH